MYLPPMSPKATVEMRLSWSLRTRATLWTITAFFTGVVSAWLWFSSQAAWTAHLNRAFSTGLELYEALRENALPPPNLKVFRLTEKESNLALSGTFSRTAEPPQHYFVTRISSGAGFAQNSAKNSLSVAILSPDLKYPVAHIMPRAGRAPGAFLGSVTRLMASYCSEPVLLIQFGSQSWQEIRGAEVWGCAAAPGDWRLAAAALALLAMSIVLARATETSAAFRDFATKLRHRRRLGGPETYDAQGPRELRETVQAVNGYLSLERELLARRAMFLSGVSHDLGTPATRLRLRTALITDAELRGKLENDIDHMTRMIESVLTYTRSELNAENPRKISLISLVESVVSDYQDTNRPVTLEETPRQEFEPGHTLFDPSAEKHRIRQVPAHGILLRARPVSLQRAVSNLIDNALKYGRHARVRVESTSQVARIIVEDDGGVEARETIENLVAPFARGENLGTAEGVGLGLTIVSTIAEQHGGTLSFSQASNGLAATIEIARQDPVLN